jgi:hypothetical protein
MLAARSGLRFHFKVAAVHKNQQVARSTCLSDLWLSKRLMF